MWNYWPIDVWIRPGSPPTPAPLSCGCPWLDEDYGRQPRMKNLPWGPATGEHPQTDDSAVSCNISQRLVVLDLTLPPAKLWHAKMVDRGLHTLFPP